MDDLSSLLEKAAEAVRRDLNHIFSEVTNRKLSPASSRDLVAYTKLLSDVLDRQKEANDEVNSKTEEELKELVKELIK